MRRWGSRVFLVAVVTATAWFVIDRMVLEPRESDRIRGEAGTLADLVAAEVDAFNVRRFERTPLPGEPVEGDALAHYRAAIALMDRSGVDRDLLYHADVGDPEMPEILEALAPAFEALARGTRARTVGVFLPVLGPGEETSLAPAVRIIELLLSGAALDFEFGRAAEGLRRVEVALRAGRDLSMARPWDVPRRTLCELPIEVLGKGVAMRRLGAPERTRAIAMLRENLTVRPPVWDAFRAGVLEIQTLLAGYFGGTVTYAELATELHLPARENRWLGFVREGPTDRELLAGWHRLRRMIPEFEAEAARRPETFATWVTGEVAAYKASRPPIGEFAVVTPGLVLGSVALWGKGKRLAEEQAVLMALRLLDAEAATGALPTTLEGMIDPEAETRFPGAVWAYREDDLGRPSLFCELAGVTHLAQASRLVPVFSFR